VDSGAGEALRFVGGLPFILWLGVRILCNLDNASRLDVVTTLFLSPPFFLS
jgi:hypothetical protein